MDDLLRSYLTQHDAECPWCGHGLRGLASDRCPECGNALQLALRTSTEGRTWAWCLLSAGTGAGMGLSMALYFVLIMISGGKFPLWILASFGFVAAVGLLVALRLLGLRTRWGLIPPRTRRVLAMLSVLAAVVGPGLVFAMAYLL